MNFLSRFKSLLGGSTVVNLITGSKSTKKIDFEDAFRHIAFALIHTRANEFANVNIEAKIEKSNGELEDLPRERPLSKLINQMPNPYLNWHQTKTLLSYYLDATGNAYLYSETGDGKRRKLSENTINGIYVLPSNAVKPIFSGGKLERYEFDKGGVRETIPKENICHLKTPAAVKDGNIIESIAVGKPNQLIASESVVKSNLELVDYVNRYLERDAVPPFVLKSDRNLSSEHWNQLKSRWNEAIQNYKLLGVLEGGQGIENLANNIASDKLLNFGLDEYIILELCAIWGVPATILKNQYQNRDTARVTEQRFYQKTILPLVSNFEQFFEEHLRQIEPRLKLVHSDKDFSDPKTRLAWQQFNVTYGIKSRNEIRREQGLTEIDGGDEYLVPNNLTPPDKLGDREANATITNAVSLMRERQKKTLN